MDKLLPRLTRKKREKSQITKITGEEKTVHLALHKCKVLYETIINNICPQTGQPRRNG